MQQSGVIKRDHAAVPSEDDVRTELERILANPHFQASERRRAFLRFIVEETLAGRGERLKGFTIAVAVFGRDETFDAQADPVVRLEARRLRRDLDSYYVDEGAGDAIRIAIPKGSYVPNFEWHEAPRPVPLSSGQVATEPAEPPAQVAPATTADNQHGGRSRSRPLLIAGSLAAALVAAIGLWLVLASRNPVTSMVAAREPAVVVMPFESLSGTDTARYLAQGIGQDLISNLFRFPGFRLYALSASAENQLKGGPVEVGRGLGVTYVVNGSVRTDPEEVSVSSQVFNARTGQIVWSKTLTRPVDPKALIKVQDELAGEIASVIGQPYGVVKNDMEIQQTTPAVSSMQSYVCVLRAYGYRRRFLRADFDPVMNCLQRAVQRDPDYSDAWAMLGWLHVDAGRLGYTGDDNRQKEYEAALQATSRAAMLQPGNPLALKALAATYHYLGRYDDSERIARQAASLNPNDPEVLAQLGWRLAVRGKFDEGIPILKRAIERTVNPPSWYYHLIAVDLCLKHDYPEMLKVSERSALGDNGFSQVLLAIANAELGNDQDALQALRKLSAYEPIARDPADYMRRHGATEQIVDTLMAGLQKARQLAAKQ